MNTLPVRKHPHLKGYDYSQKGAYFITICTKDRKCLLSRIIASESVAGRPYPVLTEIGKITEEHLRKIDGLDTFVIMPNHIHMIIAKDKDGRNVSQDIRSFKTMITKKIGNSIWQTTYYDHLIRDEQDYLIKAQYIEDNPAKWWEDEMYENAGI